MLVQNQVRIPLSVVTIKQNECNSNSSLVFGKIQNSSHQAGAMVRANNLASITNISYRNVHNVSRKALTFGNSPEKVAERIARIILEHKTPHPKHPCVQEICPECTEAVKKVVLPFVQKNEPIQMTLAAFPFKAASRSKCLSEYPDMAEVVSLRFLNSVIKDIKKEYSPGAKLTIYNDGLMFTPIAVNPPDREALKYVKHVRAMLKDIGAEDNIEVKTIGDFYDGNIAGGRDRILNKYPLSIAEIKQKAVDPNDKEVDLEYYNGSKRFAEEKMAALEDGELEEILKERYEGRPDEPKGIPYNSYIDNINASKDHRLGKKTKEKLAGQIACDTIRRSKAWGAFITSQQPDALRLSCHAQSCGSSKVGIYLTPDHNNWGAPWQLTAVEIAPEQFVLAKKVCAEELGFQRVYPHYKLPNVLEAGQREEMVRRIQEKR